MTEPVANKKSAPRGAQSARRPRTSSDDPSVPAADGTQLVPAGDAIPAFGGTKQFSADQLRAQLVQATESWLGKSRSANTQENYGGNLRQFMAFVGIA